MKRERASKLHGLHGNQAKAVLPQETVWLSASAGTGKTQVLSSRVLRLLLTPHVRPEQILCLTFTKAGATEMAERINSKLAGWVRAAPRNWPRSLKRSGRKSCPIFRTGRDIVRLGAGLSGRGLRIDTIHAFRNGCWPLFPKKRG
jgi:ATP-dependent helicase/nuclease subunit A